MTNNIREALDQLKTLQAQATQGPLRLSDEENGVFVRRDSESPFYESVAQFVADDKDGESVQEQADAEHYIYMREFLRKAWPVLDKVASLGLDFGEDFEVRKKEVPPVKVMSSSKDIGELLQSYRSFYNPAMGWDNERLGAWTNSSSISIGAAAPLRGSNSLGYVEDEPMPF